jgi:hypothetical protein
VASGKSNLFKALAYITSTIDRPLLEVFPPGIYGFDWVRSRWANETDPIGFEIDVTGILGAPEIRATYSLTIANSPNGPYVFEEWLKKKTANRPEEWVFHRYYQKSTLGEYGEVSAYEPSILHRVFYEDPRVNLVAEGPKFVRAFIRCLINIGYYNLESFALKMPTNGQSRDRIGYNGYGIADYLSWLKSPDQKVAYQKIEDQMRQILPSLQSIMVSQVAQDQQGLVFAFQEKDNKYQQYDLRNASDMSDGTVMTLGLLGIMHSPIKQSALCLEEPEKGLHPGRLRWLFDKLIELAYPDHEAIPVQVLISTHSPEFVNLFKNMRDSVSIFESFGGRTRVRRLNEITESLHLDSGNDEPIGSLWATGLYENL